MIIGPKNFTKRAISELVFNEGVPYYALWLLGLAKNALSVMGISYRDEEAKDTAGRDRVTDEVCGDQMRMNW